MSLKLAIFKALGGATLAGIAAVSAAKTAPKSPRKSGGCTPCATAAAFDKARKAARTGDAGRF